MSTPNPLVPQGSLLEQQARSKSTFQVAAFIVAIHVVILGGLLFLGCKKEEKLSEAPNADTLAAPPAVTGDTNLPTDPFAVPTNAVLAAPETNVAPVVTQPVVEPGPTFPTPAGGSVSEYTVQKNDVAYKIARKHGVTLKQLQEVNAGVDLAKLKVNQKIQLPAANSAPAGTALASIAGTTASPTAGLTTHTVKGGDNLSRLAHKYGTTIKAIRDANSLKSNDIKVGQVLKIPSKTTATTKESAPLPAASEPSLTVPRVIPASPVVTPGQPARL